MGAVIENPPTEKEKIMNNAAIKTTVKDFKSGERDAKAGFYDKWYRYNRTDDGAAYDAAFAQAGMNAAGCNIIECFA